MTKNSDFGSARSDARAARRVERTTAAAILASLGVALGACGGGGGGGTATPTATTNSTTTAATYTIGGSISGLTNEGLILVNGTDTDTPGTGDQAFTFPTALAAGTAYSVSVQLQPDALKCAVVNGTGTVGTANITNVEVNCVSPSFSLGGTISGLTAAGLVLANGAATVSPAAAATSFTFPTSLVTAASFNVTVATQPSGQTCTVSNGQGVILTSSVDNVVVACH
jgi:hypothetical protein